MKRFFNILILILVLFISNTAFAKDVKFIQVADLQFKTDNESVANFEKAIEKINKTKNLDFVVFTGNNIASANPLYLEKFVKLSKKIKVPYYIEIGNQDCFKSAGVTKSFYLKKLNKFKVKRQKSFNFVVKDGNLAYVFVDGVKEYVPATNGYYKPETVAWLNEVLKKNKKRTVLIFQHFPLFDLSENSMSNLYKPDYYRDMLNEHKNVLCIFSGHYHNNYEIMPEHENGAMYIVTEPASLSNSAYREVNIIDLGDKKYEIYSKVVKF